MSVLIKTISNWGKQQLKWTITGLAVLDWSVILEFSKSHPRIEGCLTGGRTAMISPHLTEVFAFTPPQYSPPPPPGEN